MTRCDERATLGPTMADGVTMACSRHAERAASGVCGRCGDALCDDCVYKRVGDAIRCATCSSKQLRALREGRSAEAAVRRVSVFFAIAAVLWTLVAVFANTMLRRQIVPEVWAARGLVAVCAGYAALCLAAAVLLMRRRPPARVVATAVTVPWLAFVPLGTLQAISILRTLWSDAGSWVFSPEHAEARRLFSPPPPSGAPVPADAPWAGRAPWVDEMILGVLVLLAILAAWV